MRAFLIVIHDRRALTIAEEAHMARRSSPVHTWIRRRAIVLGALAALAVTAIAATPADAGSPAGPWAAPAEASAPYQVFGLKTWDDTNLVAGTGAAVDYIEDSRMQVTATPSEA